MRSFIQVFLVGLFGMVAAAPLLNREAMLLGRATTQIFPDSITNTTCTNKAQTMVSHDINVAILSICGGIAGTIQKCQGAPTATTGTSGTASFAITTTASGATINVSKGRWEHCVAAARAVCGDTPFTTTCLGGASTGDLNVVLTHT
ncbi:hypothetical protein DL93DRAFT_2071498 [Clavulina sp. PMI_390]|nr:hypothetical protein DL93DRAFT_2071498 [Clavulina sp. PMI_390]